MRWVADIGRIMIKCRQRADDTAHDRHWVGVAAETAVECRQLLVQHCVA